MGLGFLMDIFLFNRREFGKSEERLLHYIFMKKFTKRHINIRSLNNKKSKNKNVNNFIKK